MKVLITGGAGDVGGYVVKEFAKHGIPTTVLDLKAPSSLPEGVDFVQCDLMSLEAATNTIRGYDVVIHLAAIPNASFDPFEKVMSVNMVTCFNVYESVRINKIPRIVYAGSESSTGFGIHDVVLKPRYLPIDEQHPLWPHEVYSFTKRFGEEMLENFARAHGIEAISLRYCGVWTGKNIPGLAAMIAPFQRGEIAEAPWFGAYVAAQDVAQAMRLATEYRFPASNEIPFDAFYITAANTFFSEPTLSVMKRIYGEVPEVRNPAYYTDNPCASPFDIRKAQQGLGFEPKYDCRDIENWE